MHHIFEGLFVVFCCPSCASLSNSIVKNYFDILILGKLHRIEPAIFFNFLEKWIRTVPRSDN